MHNRIYLIGLGGIGSNLVRPLAQLISYTSKGEGRDLILVDGDRVEKKNLERQFFSPDDVGRNKAEVFVRQMSLLDIRVSCIPSYVSEENVEEVIDNRSIVLLAVDNNQTRKIVQEHCLTLSDVILSTGETKTGMAM